MMRIFMRWDKETGNNRVLASRECAKSSANFGEKFAGKFNFVAFSHLLFEIILEFFFQ